MRVGPSRPGAGGSGGRCSAGICRTDRCHRLQVLYQVLVGNCIHGGDLVFLVIEMEDGLVILHVILTLHHGGRDWMPSHRSVKCAMLCRAVLCRAVCCVLCDECYVLCSVLSLCVVAKAMATTMVMAIAKSTNERQAGSRTAGSPKRLKSSVDGWPQSNKSSAPAMLATSSQNRKAVVEPLR